LKADATFDSIGSPCNPGDTPRMRSISIPDDTVLI